MQKLPYQRPCYDILGNVKFYVMNAKLFLVMSADYRFEFMFDFRQLCRSLFIQNNLTNNF